MRVHETTGTNSASPDFVLNYLFYYQYREDRIIWGDLLPIFGQNFLNQESKVIMWRKPCTYFLYYIAEFVIGLPGPLDHLVGKRGELTGSREVRNWK